MIISVRSYSDFKLAANSLRHLDAVFYNDSVNIPSSGNFGLAYAFDFESGTCVVAQVSGTIAFSTADFPTANLIADRIFVSDTSALSTTF